LCGRSRRSCHPHIVLRDRIDLHRAITTYAPSGLHGITLVGDSFGDDDLLLLPETLQRLKLVQCAAISEHGMANLGRLQSLEELDLSRQRHLCDEGLQALQTLPLKRLDLRECKQITDDGLMHLPPTLTHLNLRSCSLVSDLGLAHFAPLALTNLTLDHCNAITDDGVEVLPRTLQDLSMMSCDGV
jgi:F-box/leucine-rich repeat protein 14